MARKATGTKEWRPRLKTWVGRVYIDGVRSKWTDLCTNDETVAAERLAQWCLTASPPKQTGKETFAAAAERILRKQESKKATANRRQRIRAYALPVIGHIEIAQLTPPNVNSVLTGMDAQRLKLAERATKVGAAKVAKELGLDELSLERWVRALAAGELKSFSLDTVHHMRVDISRILGALVLEGAIKMNVAEGVELPDEVEYDDRPFVVLNDDEVRRFWRRGFETELMMACLLSREFAGQRTSDLLQADYEDYDFEGWTAFVRRPKTEDQGTKKYKRRRKRRIRLVYERVRLVIPEPVRAPLLAWREKHRDPLTGELPTRGPLFPAQRGKNAGKRKSSHGNSWALRLRDALWEEGIVRPLPPRTEGGKFLVGYEQAIGEDRRNHCALQVDTEQTRKVVFHSFRRASVTALRKAGVPLRVAMLITGHSSESTHMGYDAADDAIEIPEASLASQPAHRGDGRGPTGAPSPTPTDYTTGAAAAARVDTGAAATREGMRTALEGAAVSEALASTPPLATLPAAAPEGITGALGQEPTSTPRADLRGARLASDVAQVLAALGAHLPSDVAQVLAAMLRGNSPPNGLNEGAADPNSPRNPEQDQSAPGRSRTCDLRLRRPLLGSEQLETSWKEPHAEDPYQSPSDPAIARDAGYCPPGSGAPPAGAVDHPAERTSPEAGAAAGSVVTPAQPVGAGEPGAVITPPTTLELLRATARAALEASNWALIESLRPLIDAEERRPPPAPPPISLEAFRAKREGGK